MPLTTKKTITPAWVLFFRFSDFLSMESLLKGEINRYYQSYHNPSLINENLNREGQKSYIQIPLIAEGSLIGTLNIADRSSDFFNNEHIEFAYDVAISLALSLQQAMLREKNQEYTNELEKRYAEREELLNELESKNLNLELAKFSIDKTTDNIFWLNVEGDFLYVNEAACKSLDFTKEELIALKVTDIDANITTNSWLVFIEELRHKGFSFFNTNLRRKDGSSFPIEINTKLLSYNGKEYIFASGRDITERLNAEMALKDSEATARALINASSDSIMLVDVYGNLLALNNNISEKFHDTLDNLIGKNIFDFLPDSIKKIQEEKFDWVVSS